MAQIWHVVSDRVITIGEHHIAGMQWLWHSNCEDVLRPSTQVIDLMSIQTQLSWSATATTSNVVPGVQCTCYSLTGLSSNTSTINCATILDTDKFTQINLLLKERVGGPTPWLKVLLYTGSKGHLWDWGIMSLQGLEGNGDRVPITWGGVWEEVTI
jgi:hypothetical protein